MRQSNQRHKPRSAVAGTLATTRANCLPARKAKYQPAQTAALVEFAAPPRSPCAFFQRCRCQVRLGSGNSERTLRFRRRGAREFQSRLWSGSTPRRDRLLRKASNPTRRTSTSERAVSDLKITRRARHGRNWHGRFVLSDRERQIGVRLFPLVLVTLDPAIPVSCQV